MTERPKRQNAGNRMAQLLEKEDEDDFYKNVYGGFKEEENDEEYESCLENSTDLSDTDISNTENSEESGEDERQEEPLELRQSKMDVVKAAIIKSTKQAVSVLTVKKDKDIGIIDKRDADPIERINVRESTANKSAAMRLHMENVLKLRQDHLRERDLTGVATPVVKLSQEQLLEEAKRMEIINLKSLEVYKTQEAELKKKARVCKKKALLDHFVRYFSTTRQINPNAQNIFNKPSEPTENQKTQQNFLIFSDQLAYTEFFGNPDQLPHTEKDRICAVTGFPAKYFDPLTKKPYHNASAFKTLRELYNAKHNTAVFKIP